ncbi:MAG: bifunctional diguanylate cyclase/phosphodiesterase [Nitriliruptoraceae bacterium]|nr:bifunctional diguanylate cyclase/phosphodiesterase [Nitriliruptoraceae bacterium]
MLLQDRLQHAGLRNVRTHESVGVLFIDLDDFKHVNDTHGHHVGDELLVAVAHRLSALVRPDDTLARVSGDEFVFLCERLSDRTDAERLVERIEAAFELPFELSGVQLTLSASVGLAIADPGEEITDGLLVEADTAMYRAKRRSGRDTRLLGRFDALDLAAGSLGCQLRTALDADELDVAYQPMVRTSDGSITGVEALVRWTHATRGAVSPAVIVAVAEQTELINEVGAWVLERSCEDHQRWLAGREGLSLDLAVNVSVRQLRVPDFVGMVTMVLAATGTRPEALILEVTESILMDDADRAHLVLEELRELGVRIALDDFGTGFSSLSYLQQVPADIIKIDRSFVAGIDVTPNASAILAAVTDLAHVLSLPVTAEGVETRSERDEVRTIGYEYAQGFFYAHPMSAAAIEQLLRRTGRDAGHLPSADGGPSELAGPKAPAAPTR